ncbi:MAG: CDP-alcohol phosphatidyltransferase family protein [Clostridia bacterium]|nr:CDP-alcohol phosphatidyltransferase family protein [Clostridia bacterium]
MIGVYDYTVIATYASLASAVIGIFLSFQGMTFSALLCLIVSGVFDMFDGRIARTKKGRSLREKRFGIQIDSFCDLIAFGVLPAAIGGSLLPPQASGALFFPLIGASVLYVLCGVIRLTHYNICAEEALEEGTYTGEFTGLPITTAALIFPALYLLRYLSFFRSPLFVDLWTLVMLVTAALFISKFRLRKPGKTGVILMLVAGTLIIALNVVFRLVYGAISLV